MDLIAVLTSHASSTPDKIAYTFLDQGTPITLTYKALAQKARAVAEQLIQQGINPGDRVLIVLPQSLDYLVAFFGCLYARAIAVPIYPPVRSAHVERTFTIAKDAQAKLMITDTATVAMLDEYRTRTTEAWEELNYITLTACSAPLHPTVLTLPQPDDIAFLQYTSGSTGQPKGVMVKHVNLMANCEMMKIGMSMNAESRIVSWLPLIHDMGLIGAGLLPIYLGATLYLMSPLKFIKRPIAWLEAISDYQATHSYAPNFAYETCALEISEAAKNQLDLSSWQVALNAAEPIRAQTITHFIEAFKNCGFNPQAFFPAFGLAEATLFVTGGPVMTGAKFEVVDAERLQQDKNICAAKTASTSQTLVACGKAWLAEKITIVDPETLCELSTNQIGEVWIQGPHVCSGYWNKPEISAETFAAVTSNTGLGPCLRTGDLGYLNAQGELFIVGRIKDLIIIRGKNFAPQDIEYTVERCSELIKPNSVIAFSIEQQEERLIVVLQIRTPQSSENRQQLSKLIRKNLLAEHNVLVADIVFVGRGGIPKTTSGKLQRLLCKRHYLANTLPLSQPISEQSCELV